MKKQRIVALLGASVFFSSIAVQVFLPGQASAAQITNRSLTLQAGTTDGGSKAGGVVNHFFQFTLPNAGGGNIGSIKFEYCTLAAGACTLPTGLVTTAATMGSQSGATGFSLVNTSNGAPYLTRTAAAISATQAVSYQLLSVTNPTTVNQSFYVRISSYLSEDTTGSAVDMGNVTASTARQIVLTGVMPESLVFCTAETIGLTPGGVPDCATATDGDIAFDKLFSATDTASASSQMAASTNAGQGYVVTVNGPTLTSGSNTITAVGGAGSGSLEGVSQFGMNLRANTVAASNPAVGIEVAPAANTTNYKGRAVGDYDTIDLFKFASGETIADSADGGAGGTDAQIFTISYIVNVPGSQPAGTYTTTLTYICTPTF